MIESSFFRHCILKRFISKTNTVEHLSFNAFPWQHVIKGKWEFNHYTNLILRKLSRGCSPMHSKTFYISFKSGKKSLRAGRTVTLYPALTWSPPFKSGKKVILFIPTMNGLRLIKWRKKIVIFYRENIGTFVRCSSVTISTKRKWLILNSEKDFNRRSFYLS